MPILTVERMDHAETYAAAGTTARRLSATLIARLMSRVTSVSVREGDSVSTGQELVALDSSDLADQVNLAAASVRSAEVGERSAKTAVVLEDRMSEARLRQADAGVAQAEAALRAARAQFDLAKAGPRTQERNQARLAVVQAQSNAELARREFERVKRLVEMGAIAGRRQDTAQNTLDVALAQLASAQEAERIALDGTRSEDLRKAEEGVRLAEGALREAQSARRAAQAARLQVDVRRDAVASATAGRAQASAGLALAQTQAGFASIRAPFAGVVVQRQVDPGSMAAPGVPLLTIEGGPMRLEARVPESRLKFVRVGTPVEVALEGLKPIPARVVEVRPQGDGATHTFLVRAEFSTPPGVVSGRFGRLIVTVGRRRQVRVPVAATWEREGLRYVMVIGDNGIARIRLVTLGTVQGETVEVLSGLTEGERISVNGRQGVEDGDRVNGEGR